MYVLGWRSGRTTEDNILRYKVWLCAPWDGRLVKFRRGQLSGLCSTHTQVGATGCPAPSRWMPQYRVTTKTIRAPLASPEGETNDSWSQHQHHLTSKRFPKSCGCCHNCWYCRCSFTIGHDKATDTAWVTLNQFCSLFFSYAGTPTIGCLIMSINSWTDKCNLPWNINALVKMKCCIHVWIEVPAMNCNDSCWQTLV